MEKVVRMYRNAKPAKEKDKLSKCSKWDQVCFNKYKKPVINVQVKDKLFHKIIDVKHAKVKKQ
jgi:hypothetical protein